MDGKRHGAGAVIRADGAREEGIWEEGFLEGTVQRPEQRSAPAGDGEAPDAAAGAETGQGTRGLMAR